LAGLWADGDRLIARENDQKSFPRTQQKCWIILVIFVLIKKICLDEAKRKLPKLIFLDQNIWWAKKCTCISISNFN
jgi:hypothetical protein